MNLIFPVGQAFGTTEKVIINAFLETKGIEGKVCPVNLPDVGGSPEPVKERIRFIISSGGTGQNPHIGVIGAIEPPVFAQIRETRNVAERLGGVGAVGHINLNPGDGYAGRNHGQRIKAALVIVPEKLRQEKVAVLVVLVGTEFERSSHLPRPNGEFLFAGALLRPHEGSVQSPEPQLGFHPKQVLYPRNQLAVDGPANVAEFETL